MPLKQLCSTVILSLSVSSTMLTCYAKYLAAQNTFSHTQPIALYLHFTWQLISAITVGCHQARIQEHNNIQKLYVQ